jgi:hypothetical protein
MGMIRNYNTDAPMMIQNAHIPMVRDKTFSNRKSSSLKLARRRDTRGFSGSRVRACTTADNTTTRKIPTGFTEEDHKSECL